MILKLLWPEVALIAAQNAETGIEKVESEPPDIIIMDIELPDMEGCEVIRQIRLFSEVPILVVSSRDEEINKVKAFQAGADDYIVKPFSPLDLLARLKATLRRSGIRYAEGEDLPPIVAGDLVINFGTREVLLGSQPVHLTPIEYKLLYVLVRNEGRIVTHEAMGRKVWGTAEYVDPSTVRKNIAQLRSKLGDNSGKPGMIRNERGVGYKFVRPGHR